MMPGACPDRVRAVRRVDATGRPEHDRRALVVRLVLLEAGADVGLARLPGRLELEAVFVRVVAVEKGGIALDARGDEVVGRLPEYRPALARVAFEERVGAPSLKPGR